MSENVDTYYTLLKLLGLSEEETQIFSYLNKNPGSTALSISRELNIKRTTVYRILDTLVSKDLVVQIPGDRGLTFDILRESNFERLIAQKESELAKIKDALPSFISQLNAESFEGRHKSRVVYFHGRQGLEQVTWNSTKASKILRIMEMNETMDAFTDTKFSEKVRREFVNNNITIKQLTNATKIQGYTQVEELVTKFWECRYIDPKKINIKFETLVYNDILTLYTYSGNEIFCIEIHNPYLADMHKQMFDFIWETATPLKVTSTDGEAVLDKKQVSKKR